MAFGRDKTRTLNATHARDRKSMWRPADICDVLGPRSSCSLAPTGPGYQATGDAGSRDRAGSADGASGATGNDAPNKPPQPERWPRSDCDELKSAIDNFDKAQPKPVSVSFGGQFGGVTIIDYSKEFNAAGTRAVELGVEYSIRELGIGSGVRENVVAFNNQFAGIADLALVNTSSFNSARSGHAQSALESPTTIGGTPFALKIYVGDQSGGEHASIVNPTNSLMHHVDALDFYPRTLGIDPGAFGGVISPGPSQVNAYNSASFLRSLWDQHCK